MGFYTGLQSHTQGVTIVLPIIMMTVATDSFGQNEGGFECRVKEVNLNLMSKTYFYSFIQLMLSEFLPCSRLGAGTGATDAAPAFEESPAQTRGHSAHGAQQLLWVGCPGLGGRASICRGLPLLSPTLRKSGGGASDFTKEAGNL